MEKANGLSILAECEDCKHKFEVNGNVLKHGPFTVNGNQYFLTYYDCPSCSRRHFVQVDDIVSKQKLVGITVQLAKLTSARGRGKSIPKKQSEKFKKARQHLSDYRMALMTELTGKSAIDEAGSVFELRFSV